MALHVHSCDNLPEWISETDLLCIAVDHSQTDRSFVTDISLKTDHKLQRRMRNIKGNAAIPFILLLWGAAEASTGPIPGGFSLLVHHSQSSPAVGPTGDVAADERAAQAHSRITGGFWADCDVAHQFLDGCFVSRGALWNGIKLIQWGDDYGCFYMYACGLSSYNGLRRNVSDCVHAKPIQCRPDSTSQFNA